MRKHKDIKSRLNCNHFAGWPNARWRKEKKRQNVMRSIVLQSNYNDYLLYFRHFDAQSRRIMHLYKKCLRLSGFFWRFGRSALLCRVHINTAHVSAYLIPFIFFCAQNSFLNKIIKSLLIECTIDTNEKLIKYSSNCI